jgi:penicillin amidase
MKVIRKVFKLIAILLILLLLAGMAYYIHQQPNYSGEIEIDEIQNETQVYFDDYGVPHIYAENEPDAMIALGYVHAQDRLWQMELLRRIAPGRLSEIFGAKLIKNDRLFISLGIDESSKKASEELDRNSQAYRIIESYLIGVNKFIEEGPTPIEFSLVGVDKEPYTVQDVYNIIGYMAFSFAMAHKTDPLLSLLKEKLGDDYISDLNLYVDPNSIMIRNYKMDSGQVESMLSSVSEIMDASPIPPFIGSNSWVIAPEKTQSGKVLFANDPHIGFSQPAVWYEAHIITPGYEMYGYHLGGVPFPFLGHNRDYAYGLTMFENDDIDFYRLATDPNDKEQYLTPEGSRKYDLIEKVIRVKDSADVNFTLRISKQGPLMNDAIEGLGEEEPIAMTWIYTLLKNRVMDAIYSISRAQSMKDVKYGASLIHAPGLNVMYGDASGNIAWWASASLYKLNNKANSKLILDGSSGVDGISEFLPFNENPMAENPD